MIQKESVAYEILQLLSMTGEIGDGLLKIIVPQLEYRKKVLQKLTAENMITKYYKDNLKGYRLTITGKRFMLQNNSNRFEYFLKSNADSSMRRSDKSHRLRQHRISEILAVIYLSDIDIFRDKKPNIFQKQEKDIKNISFINPAFFIAKELKDMGSFSTKIISSRLIGLWLNSKSIWICYHYNSMNSWFSNIEKRADIFIRSLLKKYDYTNAVLFYNNSFTELYSDNSKLWANILQSPFKKFCCVPMNDKGIILLKLISNNEKYKYLIDILKEDLIEFNNSKIINDGYNHNKEPVLVLIDFDIKKLLSFVTQLRYLKQNGEIICFDFQKEDISKYCNETVKISTVDFEVFRENFFPKN